MNVSQQVQQLLFAKFPHTPTEGQVEACRLLTDFLFNPDPLSAFVLKGYAGTGKTTLVSALIQTLPALRVRSVLLAPTGRAAKVLSNYSGRQALTIHKKIYATTADANGLLRCSRIPNKHSYTLFIVDEASMIGEDNDSGRNLLDDLVSYVKEGSHCRLMLIGDTAQLPPVGEEESPALISGMLRNFGLKVHECDLNEVLRQSRESGILWNATMVRQMITHDDMPQLPKMHIQGFPDISVVPGDELIESLASSYSRVGVDETIVVTRSNKRANIYNEGIRRTILDRDDELCRGDQLMIVKNKYLTALPQKEKPTVSLDFLANGDRCVVQRVRRVHELYGFRFAEVTIQLPDYDDYELTTTALLDTLTSEAPALTREQQELLYNNVLEDYADIALKSERIKKLKSDAHYNALQIKFGYAVTCHKAQGGQWAHVSIDQGYMTDNMLTPDYIHWLYTALTRATERVFLVNWPKTQVSAEEE